MTHKFKQGDRVKVALIGQGEVVYSNRTGKMVQVQMDNGLRHAVPTKMLTLVQSVKVGMLVEHADGQFDGAKRVRRVDTLSERGSSVEGALVGNSGWWPLSELRVLTEDDLYSPPEPETLTLQVKFDNPGAASGTTGMLSAVEAALEEFGVTGFTIEVVDNE